ncbi:helix-loop-helix DNA-binding domain-containing protein [Radiomyces spectabilis]|uniref:helix-loop-helix DNA-binding domain-containing protein n=1 Tax=Radiomyces spectabilis TaxID=64574 RepID=UPI00221E9D10|nr:helix-loop-helix DNA-binding domain-containing protein [Radiomyces spectabilis]KAI8384779.1 helix-loop-helix DNA-binding domain-containing protein [Radiomyces spectabilis]
MDFDSYFGITLSHPPSSEPQQQLPSQLAQTNEPPYHQDTISPESDRSATFQQAPTDGQLNFAANIPSTGVNEYPLVNQTLDPLDWYLDDKTAKQQPPSLTPISCTSSSNSGSLSAGEQSPFSPPAVNTDSFAPSDYSAPIMMNDFDQKTNSTFFPSYQQCQHSLQTPQQPQQPQQQQQQQEPSPISDYRQPQQRSPDECVVSPPMPISSMANSALSKPLPSSCPIENTLSYAFGSMTDWAEKQRVNHSGPHPPSKLVIANGQQLKKVAHNAIERRYRNNINDRIRDLKSVVPALYLAKVNKNNKSLSPADDEDDDGDDGDDHGGEIVEGVEVAKKLNKAVILHKATEYIKYLKHMNSLAQQESEILQQILGQMPGGAQVLNRFRVQKEKFRKFEEEQLARERKETMERERIERQRILKERAVQRAALTELLPKTERRPYRRRCKKVDTAAASCDLDSPLANDNSAGSSPSVTFMAFFMCLSVFSVPFYQNPSSVTKHHQMFTDSIHVSNWSTMLDIRFIAKCLVCCCMAYCFIAYMVRQWLHPRPPVLHSKRKGSYASARTDS